MNVIQERPNAIEEARDITKRYEFVIKHARSTFTAESLNKIAEERGSLDWQSTRVDAFCKIASEADCINAISNLSIAKKDLKKIIFVRKKHFDQLPADLILKLKNKFNIRVYQNNEVGKVIDRQIVKNNAPTVDTKSIGSATGSLIYTVTALGGSSGTGNYDPLRHLAATLAGGFVGEAFNSNLGKEYRFLYRLSADESIAIEGYTSSPIGLSIGTCIEVSSQREIEPHFCEENQTQVYKFYRDLLESSQ